MTNRRDDMLESKQPNESKYMNKINLTKTGLFVSCIIGSSTIYSQDRPNIIYILADDLGSGDISSINKNSFVKTEAIDRLAKEGVLFSDAHTPSSVSSPTRYGVVTGRYCWRTKLQAGVLWGASPLLLKEEEPTVASLLKANGYSTAVVGKWHLGLGWQNIKNDAVADFEKPISNGAHSVGFDYSYIMPASLDIPPYIYIKNGKQTAPATRIIDGTTGYNFYRKGNIADDFDINNTLDHFSDVAVEYIEERAKEDKPFFLYYPLTAPHAPIIPSQKFKGESGGTDYTDFLLHVDDVVARVVDAVKRSGIEEETIIIFTSDNGCSPAARFDELAKIDHDPSYIYRGMKADIYEGGHRVPFIVKYPNVAKVGHVSTQLTCLTNLYATCAEIIGADMTENEGVDSHSILSALQGAESTSDIAVVHHSVDGYFSIRKGDWKLIVAKGSGGWSDPKPGKEAHDAPAMQLFNLKDNIAEDSEYNLYDIERDRAHDLFIELTTIVDNGRSTKGKRQGNDVHVRIMR